MTYCILLAIAIILTIVSLRWRNILFTLGGTIGWLTLWVYNFDNPPTNITQGSTAHEFLIYTFIVMAIATLLMYFRNRNRGYSGYPRTPEEQAEYDRTVKAPPAPQPYMEMGEEEYRNRVRKALRPNRRRR